MEDVRLIQAKMRQQELIVEARIARHAALRHQAPRPAAPRPPALNDRFGRPGRAVSRPAPLEGALLGD